MPSALDLAVRVAGADVVIVAMGPGVVGTGVDPRHDRARGGADRRRGGRPRRAADRRRPHLRGRRPTPPPGPQPPHDRGACAWRPGPPTVGHAGGHAGCSPVPPPHHVETGRGARRGRRPGPGRARGARRWAVARTTTRCSSPPPRRPRWSQSDRTGCGVRCSRDLPGAGSRRTRHGGHGATPRSPAGAAAPDDGTRRRTSCGSSQAGRPGRPASGSWSSAARWSSRCSSGRSCSRPTRSRRRRW